jgi:hypothetical protein
MSNTNAPFGFRWLGMALGGPASSMALVPRKIAFDNSTPIYRGDTVIDLGTGYVGQGTTGVAGSNTIGIFWGVEYLSTSAGRNVFSTYWPAADHAYDGNALIIPIAGVPPQLFLVQATSTNFTIADIGSNYEIVVGTGSVAGGYGKSGMTLSQSTHATTATLPFRCVGLYSSIAPSGAPGTDDTSNYNLVLAQSNPFNSVGI